jgi:hypothetical protein
VRETLLVQATSLVDLAELPFQFDYLLSNSRYELLVGSPAFQLPVPHDLHFKFHALIFVGHGAQFRLSYMYDKETAVLFNAGAIFRGFERPRECRLGKASPAPRQLTQVVSRRVDGKLSRSSKRLCNLNQQRCFNS